MTKKEIKNILMSMRVPDNENTVNYLLGKIDTKEESEIESIFTKLGNDENKIKSLLEKELLKIQHDENNQINDKFPINAMFTYGITGKSIHLHLPIDLHESLYKNGISKTIAMVNLYLLDAIDRIKKLKDDGFYKFNDIDSIYMISPTMVRSEMRFLESLDFVTKSYSKKQLKDEDFVKENAEAQLAVSIFGKEKNVGTAFIRFDIIYSKEWQDKKKQILEELRNKGTVMNEKSDIAK